MRAVRRFLVRSLQEPPPPLPSLRPQEWQVLPHQAYQHGLSPRVNALLDGTSAPDDVRAALRADTRRALAGQLQVEADLRRLLRVLDSTSVLWAAVKGPVLADHWYRPPGQRDYSDLDVVVAPSEFGRVLTALTSQGVRLVDRNWTLALLQQRAELSLQLWHGTALDLHWHVLNTPVLRAEIPLDITATLARTQRVTLNDRQSVRTLDPEDTLLHLCLHTTLSGGHRLGWYRDIEQVVSRGTVDWDTFITRTLAAGAGLPVCIALHRARRLAGALIPRHVEATAADRGRAWVSLIAALDALRPPGHPIDSRLSGRLLVEASRADTFRSIRALRRSLTNDLVSPLLHDPQHPWRRVETAPGGSPDNPLWHDASDPSDERRYLDFVETHGTRAS